MRHHRLALIVVAETVVVAGLLALAAAGPDSAVRREAPVRTDMRSEKGPASGSATARPGGAEAPPDDLPPAIAAAPFAEPILGGAGDPVGIVLHGRVRGRDGAAVESARVEVRDRFGRRAGSGGGGGKAGRYAIAGLEPGPCRVFAAAPGFRDANESFDLAATPNPHRRDFVLERAPAVRIRLLTPEGTPFPLRKLGEDRDLLEALTVVATAEEPREGRLDRLPRPGLPFEGGRFRRLREVRDSALGLGPEHLGVLELLGDGPVFASLVLGAAVLGTLPAGPGTADLAFTLTPDRVLGSQGAIRLRVDDAATGAPLPSFPLMSGARSWSTDRLPRDADGFLVLRPIVAGRHRLQVGGGARERVVVSVDVPPGGTAEAGVIRLRAAAAISGCVVDAEGAPAIAAIHAIPLDAGAAAGGGRPADSRNATDVHGRFELAGLAPARHAVSASAAGWSSAVHVVLAGAAGSDTVRLVLAPAQEVILDAGAAGWSGRDLFLRGASGTTQPWRSFDADTSGPLSTHLPPGDYVLDVASGGRTERSIPFRVAAEPVRVEIGP